MILLSQICILGVTFADVRSARSILIHTEVYILLQKDFSVPTGKEGNTVQGT